jgi:ABC-2 type transport system permease protein
MQKSTFARSFLTATWLGWQIESNWTDPFLFAIYSIVKPISSAAILVVMYGIITKGAFGDPLFPYMYLGNVFYMYVGAVMTGVSWSVLDDREHYKTLKYIYVAPVSIPMYLLGRGVSRFITGSIAVIITITAGVLFLNVPLDITKADWLLFIPTLLVGVIMLAMMGLIIAGITLITVRHEGFAGEAVAGLLYIFSGAIFPLDVLPAFLRPIGFFMPTTYWLELLRRALVGSVAKAYPTLAGFSNAEIFGILLAFTVALSFIGLNTFRYFDHKARERGMIDRTSNY